MFKTKTVDGILSVFNKAVKELEELAVVKSRESDEKASQALVLNIAAKSAKDEASRAKAAAAKINAITA